MHAGPVGGRAGQRRASSAKTRRAFESAGLANSGTRRTPIAVRSRSVAATSKHGAATGDHPRRCREGVASRRRQLAGQREHHQQQADRGQAQRECAHAEGGRVASPQQATQACLRQQHRQQAGRDQQQRGKQDGQRRRCGECERDQHGRLTRVMCMGRSVARCRCRRHPAAVGGGRAQVGFEITTRIGMCRALCRHGKGCVGKRAIHGPQMTKTCCFFAESYSGTWYLLPLPRTLRRSQRGSHPANGGWPSA